MHSQTQPRVYTEAERMVPRGLVIAVVSLLAACLAIVAFARITDRPLEATPPVSGIKTEADIVLTSHPMSGAVSVADLSGEELVALSPEEGGFIAGVHRVILRERALRRLPEGGPVRLIAYDNGRMAIYDPSSGWSADLMGFGQGNAEAFARLLALIEKGKL